MLISALSVFVSATALVFVGAPAEVMAQEPSSRVAEGRVQRADADGRPVPVAGLWVVLHRVGSDRSAPLDSVRTDGAGRYRIRYAISGDPDALYFVSARYDGIAYFSPPLRAAVTRPGDGDVMVYSTTVDTTQLRVQGKHFVVSAPRGDRREIAEVFELENVGFRTVIARDSVTPLWSTMLPARAESASVAPGDLSASAVVFRRGRAEVYSPIPPGVRQLVLTYSLPAAGFPLVMPAGRPISVFEVLLEEPRAIVEGARLGEVEPASIEGRIFRRFLAQDVPASAVMRVNAPPPIEQSKSAIRIVGIAAALGMLAALGMWAMRRRRLGPAEDGRAVTGLSNLLIAELATLDARFEKEPPGSDARTTYQRERQQLKERIAHSLAAERGAG